MHKNGSTDTTASPRNNLHPLGKYAQRVGGADEAPERGKTMPEVEREHLQAAMDHVQGIRDIYRILDGEEWSPDTIDEVSQVITRLGYEIHDPDFDVRKPREVWEFQATMYIYVDDDGDGQKVSMVTVAPNMGSDITLLDIPSTLEQAEYKTELDHTKVDELLSKYLTSVKENSWADGERFETYPLAWEG